MIAFFIENKIFFVSAALLGTLVVGASQLQEMRGPDGPHGEGSSVATQSSGASSPWQAPVSASASTQTSVTSNVVPKTTPAAATSPAPRRVYNRGRDDD